MRVNLNVPFSEKNAAKSLGAQWDATNRTWYSEDNQNLARFKAWLPISEVPSNIIEPEDEVSVTLSSFLSKVKQAFDQHCALTSWIKAEVTEYRDKSGNCYITLAEYTENESTLEREERARISCNLWKNRSKPLLDKFHASTGSTIKPGMKIMLLAKADYHPKYGVSLTILDIDPNYTLGDLEANLRKIREVLKNEGVYKRNKALQIPKDFVNVAVITPTDGAGLGDFCKEANLLKQYGLCQFDYYEATFQGEGAVESIISSLEKIKSKGEIYDAIIIIRGGGAATDLAWLNSLPLARKICTFGLPVFSGIGHERDNTIVDEISCCRFDTPSKVSHYILSVICENAKNAHNDFLLISNHADKKIQKAFEKIDAYGHVIKLTSHYTMDRLVNDIESFRKVLLTSTRQLTSVNNILNHNYENLTSRSLQYLENRFLLIKNMHNSTLRQSLYATKIIENRLSSLFLETKNFGVSKLQDAEKNVNHLHNNILRFLGYHIELKEQHLTSNYFTFKANLYSALDKMTYQVEAYMRQIFPQDPRNTLLRGFALVRDNKGKIIDSVEKAKAQSSVTVEFRNGEITLYNKEKFDE